MDGERVPAAAVASSPIRGVPQTRSPAVAVADAPESATARLGASVPGEAAPATPTSAIVVPGATSPTAEVDDSPARVASSPGTSVPAAEVASCPERATVILGARSPDAVRSEEHTSELQPLRHLV